MARVEIQARPHRWKTRGAKGQRMPIRQAPSVPRKPTKSVFLKPVDIVVAREHLDIVAKGPSAGIGIDEGQQKDPKNRHQQESARTTITIAVITVQKSGRRKARFMPHACQSRCLRKRQIERIGKHGDVTALRQVNHRGIGPFQGSQCLTMVCDTVHLHLSTNETDRLERRRDRDFVFTGRRLARFDVKRFGSHGADDLSTWALQGRVCHGRSARSQRVAGPVAVQSQEIVGANEGGDEPVCGPQIDVQTELAACWMTP